MISPERDADAAVRTRFTLALVLSLLIVVVGTVWTWRVGQESNRVAHQLFHTKEGLEGLRHILARQEARKP